MDQGHLMTTEIKNEDLIRSDEHARSAVLLRFHFEQYHRGMLKWIEIFGKNPTCQHTTSLSEFIAKQFLSVKPEFETRAKCQDFVDRYKDDGISYEIDSHFLQRQSNYHCPPIQIN